MSLSLSSVPTHSIRVGFESKDLSFVNEDRGAVHAMVEVVTESLSASFPKFTSNIRSINFADNYFTFLTGKSSLSAYLSTEKTVEGHEVGLLAESRHFQYNAVRNDFTPGLSAHNATQFLGIVDRNNKFNIMPLKTRMALDGHQVSLTDDYRDYQKIYDVNDSLFLQFKVDRMAFEVKPDEYTVIRHSYNVPQYGINSSDFDEQGAIGGNTPLNSDVIFFDNDEYGLYSDNGTDNSRPVNNGTMLCLWLSAQSPDPASSKVWMERWYDPSTVTQGEAFIASLNGLYTRPNHIYDNPSLKTVSPREKLTYLRYGPSRNASYVDSLSSNLILSFSDWGKNFSSSVNQVSAFVIGDYPLDTDTLVLNGTIHGHIPPEDICFPEGDFTVGLWAFADDWNLNNDAQLFGNHYNESGYGIFYNTGTSNNLISVPTIGDNLFALNDRGFKVFEKDLKSDLGLSGLAIDYIKTDLFGNRWVYDSFNHSLYKIENDDLVSARVELPVSSQITKIECNSQNEISILDNFTHTISSMDSSGTWISTQTLSAYHNNFEIDINDAIIYDTADFLTVNSINQKIKVLGPTVYIDNVRVLYLTERPQCLRLDLEDNIWILMDARILKLDPAGNLLLDQKLELSFTDTDAEMCFVKTHHNNRERIDLWIIFNKGKQILVVDTVGRTTKRIDLSKLFIGRHCGGFQLNIIGDFSGFDNKRKFERVDGKVISPSNPAITVRMGLGCGIYRRIVQIHAPTTYLDKWSHFACTLKRAVNSTTVKLYINGLEVATKTISGNHHIMYGHRTSPFIIGGNSGKLGARNLEKSIARSGFFIGELDDIKVYDRFLNGYEIYHMSLHGHYDKWDPISFHLRIPETTVLEEVDTFHINRYKGFKSNYFNIRIRNFSDDEKLQSVVGDYIRANIHQFIPAHTILNEITFE